MEAAPFSEQKFPNESKQMDINYILNAIGYRLTKFIVIQNGE